ncbi:hypothetical protein GEMRC1_006246 [Eukaryota sp. GEM-RC1]
MTNLTASLTLQLTERAIKYTYDLDNDKWVNTAIIVQIDPSAFSQGNLRAAHKLHDFSVTDSDALLVAKFPRKDRPTPPRHLFFKDVKCQMIAKRFAEAYNELNPPKLVSFLPAYVLELCDRPGRPLCHCEKYIDGIFQKHNNNYGWYSPDSRNTPQAFSHFTYHHSSNSLLICDIQGWDDLYTDPQCHSTASESFGLGDLGSTGIQQFLQTHNCNDICKSLGLPSVGSFCPGMTVMNTGNENVSNQIDNTSRNTSSDFLKDLIDAITLQRLDVVKKIIVWCEINPESILIEGRNLLFLACASSSPEVLSFLLTTGIDVNFVDPKGITPLMIASKEGNLPCVQVLIDAGVNLDVVSLANETALGFAVENLNFEICKILINNDASLSLQHKGKTLMSYLFNREKTVAQKSTLINELVDLLLNKGYNINSMNDLDGFSILHYVLSDLNIIKNLVSRGADCKLVHKLDNSTLLFNLLLLQKSCDFWSSMEDCFSSAIKRGDLEFSKLIVSLGGRPSLSNLISIALDFCSIARDQLAVSHSEILKYLISLDSSLKPHLIDLCKQSKPSSDENVLSRCVLSHHTDSAELLLSFGVVPEPNHLDYLLFLVSSQPLSETSLSTIKWLITDLLANPLVSFGSNGETCLEVCLLKENIEVAGFIFDNFLRVNPNSLKKMTANSDKLLSSAIVLHLSSDVLEFVIHLLGADANGLDYNDIPFYIVAILSHNRKAAEFLKSSGVKVPGEVVLWAFALICTGKEKEVTGDGDISISKLSEILHFLTHDLSISPMDSYPSSDPLIQSDLTGLPFFFQSILSGNVSVADCLLELGCELTSEMVNDLITATIDRSTTNPLLESTSYVSLKWLLSIDQPLNLTVNGDQLASSAIDHGLVLIYSLLKNFSKEISDSDFLKLIRVCSKRKLGMDIFGVLADIIPSTLDGSQVYYMLVVATINSNTDLFEFLIEKFKDQIFNISEKQVADWICFFARCGSTISLLDNIAKYFKISKNTAGNADLLSFLLDSTAIPTTSSLNTSPLFEALSNTTPMAKQLIQKLIGLDFDLSVTDSSKNTLVHQSVVLESEELTIFLMELGLDVHKENVHGISAYSIAGAELKQKILGFIDVKSRKSNNDGQFDDYLTLLRELLIEKMKYQQEIRKNSDSCVRKTKYQTPCMKKQC